MRASLASIHTTEQEGEQGVYGRDPGALCFFVGFVLENGGKKEMKMTGLSIQVQAVFSRSWMAFCCVSFSVETHCVHNPADTWEKKKTKKVFNWLFQSRLKSHWHSGMRFSLTCTWRMTFASRLLQASSVLTDSFATPSAMMRKTLGRLEFSGPRTIGLLLWRREGRGGWPGQRFQHFQTPNFHKRVTFCYLSMRSHRKSNVWTASSLSSLRGSQLSQWGRTSPTFTHSGRNLMSFPTAEMQFSVALTFSFDRESAAWMAPTSRGSASAKQSG